MNADTTERGFRLILHPRYVEDQRLERVVGESSAVGDYEDSWDNPGSSYLWLGEHIHLNREDVGVLIAVLKHWLEHKRLPSEIVRATVVKKDTLDVELRP